jgi:hypothetical protein
VKLLTLKNGMMVTSQSLSDVGLKAKDKIIEKRFGSLPNLFYICIMNNIATYIGGLTASWTAMNSRPRNSKPTNESLLMLICTMGFLLGFIIGLRIIYFILK